MSDIRDLYKLVTELEQSYDENTMYVGDAFGIELSEHFLIETSIAGFTKDGVILESDSKMLEFFDIHDIRLDESVKDKLVAAMMAAGIAAGGAGLYHSDQQAFKASVQLQQLQQQYHSAKAKGDREAMRDLEQLIKQKKDRISLGRGLGRDVAQLHYDRTLSRSDLNESRESVEQAIIHRLVHQHLDLLQKYGPESVSLAIEDLLDSIPDDLEEIGSSDVSGWVRQIEDRLERGGYDTMSEAEYQGREVTLDKPKPNPDGKSKSMVYVKDGDKVKKVTFGDPDMRIRKNNPKARKNFRARHQCDNPDGTLKQKDKTTAAYWSCKAW